MVILECLAPEAPPRQAYDALPDKVVAGCVSGEEKKVVVLVVVAGRWGPAKYIPAVVIVLKAGMCNQSCFLTRAEGGSCCCFRANGR